MPKNVVAFGKRDSISPRFRGRTYSKKWGLFREGPEQFGDEWQRLRAAAKAQKLSRDARKRLDWMIWYETNGKRNARATCRHFGIAPKVFYFWRKRYSPTALAHLEDRSHRPHRVRTSTLTGIQIERIVALRRQYMRYSKIKLAILYREHYGEPISSWKIQQVIQRFRLYPNPKRAENTAKKRRQAWKKKRITELTTKPQTGFLFSIDTVVRHFGGNKRYILTAIDRHSRLAFARMYSSHSSLSAADFLRRLHRLMDGQMVHIQTDNGSEFHKHFAAAAKELKLQHWWSRTKTPKDNAICERFNRTLQDEFIGEGNAISNIAAFNGKLTDWLIEYDFHRPHAALGYRRPIEIASGAKNVLPINPSHTNCCAAIAILPFSPPLPLVEAGDAENRSFSLSKEERCRMANLTRAHDELFRRAEDECFSSLDELIAHCRDQRESANEFWHPPGLLMPQVAGDSVRLHIGSDGAFAMNHWSFSQLCSLAGVSRDTINILSPETASRALQETKPAGQKPLQVLIGEETVRAIHGTQYSRLWNADLLEAVREAAPDFQPPQKAVTGGTGLYCGEQDLFAFLIDPAGWTEIGGEAFAPGFFVWNSEVGKRSLGVQTFWFQTVCMNHIVWDAVEVVEFKRKHTGNVGDSLVEVHQIVEALAKKRDDRKDGFAKVIAKAMDETIGDADEATKFLSKQGINRSLVKRAVGKLSQEGKPFTLWTLVDQLTQLTQTARYAGDRTDADAKVGQILALAA